MSEPDDFTTPDERFERYRTAYLEMAKTARYRPVAPSDGLGNVQLSKSQMADPARLSAEAVKLRGGFCLL